MKRKVLYLLATMPLFMALWGCNAEEMISHVYRCYFYFNTNLHLNSKLWTAINNGDYFVWVEHFAQTESNYPYIIVHPADNSGDEKITLTTDVENLRTYELGAYNGIFIGRSNFGGHGRGMNHYEVAYDRQCPNCIATDGLPKYPLRWVEKSPMKVTCASCKRVYSLETGASETGGKPLMEYNVDYNGGIIVVNN